MTIGELIQILENYPSDMCVVVSGYEEGYDDLSPEQISVVKIELNTGTQAWQGKHRDIRDRPRPTAGPCPRRRRAGPHPRIELMATRYR